MKSFLRLLKLLKRILKLYQSSGSYQLFVDIRNLCSQSPPQRRDKIYSPNTCGSNKTHGPQKSYWSKVRIAIYDVEGIWYPEYIGSVLLKRAILLFSFSFFSQKFRDTRNFLCQESGARSKSVDTSRDNNQIPGNVTFDVMLKSLFDGDFPVSSLRRDTYSNNWHRRANSHVHTPSKGKRYTECFSDPAFDYR